MTDEQGWIRSTNRNEMSEKKKLRPKNNIHFNGMEQKRKISKFRWKKKKLE